MHRALIPASLVLAGLFTACGKPEPAPTPPAPTRPPIEACNLILQREAEAAAGMPVDTVATPLDRAVGDTAAKCSFGAPIDGVYKIVSLEVRRFPGPAEARKSYTNATRALRRLSLVAPVPVAEVGEEAVWVGGQLNQLQALSGDHHLLIMVEVGDEAGRPAAARTLALNAIERLAGRGVITGRPGSVVAVPSEE